MSKQVSKPRAMVVAGVMSGTSADGADVAICRISATSAQAIPKLKVLKHQSFPYPKPLRSAVLAAMDAKRTSAAELARLSWRLGKFYVESVETTATQTKLKPQLVACHGQTIYHQAQAAQYAGAAVRCTWQIGEAALIAEQLRLPVVSDFRPADMAAGGQGAPLVPMLDFCVFRHATKNRLLMNLGGIANVTAMPAGCGAADVMAFDTGPSNMVIDACMQSLYGRAFDRDGATAAQGRVLQSVVDKLMRAPYFSAQPPKSCGREEFGAEFAQHFIAACQRISARKQDVIATATAFTAETVLAAYRRFCWPHFGQRAPLARTTEAIIAGGGAHNRTLMRLLTEGLAPLGVKMMTTADLGIAIEAKEAAAFALLGWLTWHGLPGNVPSATGAARAVVLGKVTRV